jgi:hypothetical protein
MKVFSFNTAAIAIIIDHTLYHLFKNDQEPNSNATASQDSHLNDLLGRILLLLVSFKAIITVLEDSRLHSELYHLYCTNLH